MHEHKLDMMSEVSVKLKYFMNYQKTVLDLKSYIFVFLGKKIIIFVKPRVENSVSEVTLLLSPGSLLDRLPICCIILLNIQMIRSINPAPRDL